MTLTLETSVETLTLNVPPSLAAEKRLRLAVALYDAELLTQGQAAAMANLSRAEFFDALGRFGITPFQYTWDDAFAEANIVRAQEQTASAGD
jgi:predicted HTH domain antitoxin